MGDQQTQSEALGYLMHLKVSLGSIARLLYLFPHSYQKKP